MDTVLISVTGVSLALAAGMGVLLARMVREERRRSDARVHLLEELAAAPVAKSRPAEPRFSDIPSFLVPEHGRTQAPVAQVPSVHELFHEELEPSAWPRRLAVIGSLAAVLALAIFGWSQLRETGPDSAETTVARASAPSLELLSLRHTREGNTLTVTGLVQNPKGGAALANVQATLLVFGPGGTFVTSARVPLDFTSLTPGDESPFVIRVPVSGEVARYRVGFRGPDDRVVGHIDRRTDQVGRNF
jgi:hypothetical protein